MSTTFTTLEEIIVKTMMQGIICSEPSKQSIIDSEFKNFIFNPYGCIHITRRQQAYLLTIEHNKWWAKASRKWQMAIEKLTVWRIAVKLWLKLEGIGGRQTKNLWLLSQSLVWRAFLELRLRKHMGLGSGNCNSY